MHDESYEKKYNHGIAFNLQAYNLNQTQAAACSNNYHNLLVKER